MGYCALVTYGLLLITSAQAAATTDPLATDTTSRVRLRLVAPGLGRGVIHLLQTEVEAIWVAHGVRITWAGTDDLAAVAVVIERSASALPPGSGDEQWPVAATRAVAGNIAPEMYVSLDAALRVVHASSPPYSAPALAGIIVPRVAGRAIAHELAHFLLDTRHHASRGLLRARISANEFVDPDAKGLSWSLRRLRPCTVLSKVGRHMAQLET